MSQALERCTPESVGIPAAAIDAFVTACQEKVGGLHSYMLLRHGQVASQAWWAPYSPTRPHMLFSLSKSFTSTAVGLAVHEGLLSVDDKVLQFFPDEAPSHVSRNLAAMTVHHLLSMNTGHHTDASGATFKRADDRWAKRFLALPVQHKPGTYFVYNTAATYMLSAIVHRLTGMPIVQYLQPRLFDPLGIAPPYWETDPLGVNTGGYGLNLKTEDIARFAQMLLQKGRWAGEQIVPAEWIATASSYHSDNSINGGNPEWTQGYGYQFWLCRHGAYRGDGAFGQYCLVMPEQDAVLAITSGVGDMQAVLDAVWDHLLPAMSDSTAPDAAADAALSARLAALRIEPVTGPADSPQAATVATRRYAMDANDAGIKTVRLQSTPQGAVLTVRDRVGTHKLHIGHDEQIEAGTTLSIERGRFRRDRTKRVAVASGAWTAPDTYTTRVCLVETPFIPTLTAKFTGDDIEFTYAPNVGFGGAPVVLHGTATS